MSAHVCEARRAAWDATDTGDKRRLAAWVDGNQATLIPCPSPAADPPGCGASAGSPCACLAALGAAWAAQGRGGIVREPDDAATGGAVDSDRGGDSTPAIDLGALLAGVSAVFAGYDRLRVEREGLLALVRDLRAVIDGTIVHRWVMLPRRRCPSGQDCPACAVLVRADAVGGGT